MSQAQRRIPAYRSLGIQNSGDAVRRHLEPTRSFSALSAFRRDACQDGWRAQALQFSQWWSTISTFSGPRASVGLLDTDPPPVVDADAALPLAVALERFKTVAGQSAKIPDIDCWVPAVQLEQRSLFDGIHLADRKSE